MPWSEMIFNSFGGKEPGGTGSLCKTFCVCSDVLLKRFHAYPMFLVQDKRYDMNDMTTHLMTHVFKKDVSSNKVFFLSSVAVHGSDKLLS